MRIPFLPRRSDPPLLSIVVVFHQMAREAPRTLFSLTPRYQRGIDGLSYEVIVVDHGSFPALDPALTAGFGRQFVHRRVETDSPSPVVAINDAVAGARGRLIAVLIDGARILSPGLLAGIVTGSGVVPAAFVHTVGLHLGPGPQNDTALRGYDQGVEDAMLAEVDWRQDGYRLFDISTFAMSSRDGFFSDLSESNCFGLPREVFLEMGGYHPGYRSPGGGLCNLDFYNRALQHSRLTAIRLLGEGTFHQFHGGVASNAPADRHPWDHFQAEHVVLRGGPWTAIPMQDPIYLGRMREVGRRFSGEPRGGRDREIGSTAV